jgi:hypothetical protein
VWQDQVLGLLLLALEPLVGLLFRLQSILLGAMQDPYIYSEVSSTSVDVLTVYAFSYSMENWLACRPFKRCSTEPTQSSAHYTVLLKQL